MKKGEAELIVSRYNSINLDFHFDGTTSFLGRATPRLSISEKGEGCACSILTDEADWNAQTWDLRLDLLPDLALALLFISEFSSDGYIFEALWAGDKPEKNVEVSIDEILQIVQRNQIGPKTRYIVRAGITSGLSGPPPECLLKIGTQAAAQPQRWIASFRDNNDA